MNPFGKVLEINVYNIQKEERERSSTTVSRLRALFCQRREEGAESSFVESALFEKRSLVWPECTVCFQRVKYPHQEMLLVHASDIRK